MGVGHTLKCWNSIKIRITYIYVCDDPYQTIAWGRGLGATSRKVPSPGASIQCNFEFCLQIWQILTFFSCNTVGPSKVRYALFACIFWNEDMFQCSLALFLALVGAKEICIPRKRDENSKEDAAAVQGCQKTGRCGNDQWLVWSPPDGSQGGQFGVEWRVKKTKERNRKESIDESNIRFLKMEIGRNELWLVCSPTGTFCHKQPGNMAWQLKSKSEREENSYWQVIFCSFPWRKLILECFSSPESALSFSFKVDNKLQRMRSAVHLRGKTCCSQIHLFDIIVLADPCARPSEFWFWIFQSLPSPPSSPPPSCTKTWQGVLPPPLWSTAPHKDLCRNRCVCRSKKWKIPAQNVSLPASYYQMEDFWGKCVKMWK